MGALPHAPTIHPCIQKPFTIMKDTNIRDKEKRDRNEDPITGEPGSHPVGTGIGAAGGGAAGAAIGTAVGGPIGTAVGAVIGAVAGGYAGHAAGEAIDPTVEDAYWRENHSNQPFAKSGASYDDYQPAYRSGYEGYSKHGKNAASFEQAEPSVRRDYESSGAKLPWERARDASRAAWTRLHEDDSVRVPISEEEVKVGKREVEAGAVRIRKEVRSETVNQPVDLRREEIVVERVEGGGDAAEDAFREGEVRIPLKREEAVVEKTAKVTGEVKVRKAAETDTQQVSETIRKEDVKVEGEGEARIRR
jgi:uncharacterized protein (TIGR02271 family)